MSTEPAQFMPASAIEARLADYGLQASPQTLAFLQGAVADLEAAAANIRRPRSYLQEPAHALRLRNE